VKELIVLLAADLDIQRIFDLHEDRREGAGVIFMERLGACFGQLRRFPESGPAAYKRYRRLLVPKTMYAIYYAVEPRGVTVRAVMDVRQGVEAIIRRLTS
jgi:plasmid stabilization system protein ParE